jgi:ribosome biogenesis GTPase A
MAKKNFWFIVNNVIGMADIILIVLDARLINETRNIEVENKVKAAKKPIIYVLAKSDLVDRESLAKFPLKPAVIMSAKERKGTHVLRERIWIEGKRAYPDKETVTVGVLGYPNVGKSSLINAMSGRHAAPTSSISNYTKKMRKVKSGKIKFLDTPGVIPYEEKDAIKHASTGTLSINKVKDPDLVVIDLMQKYPGKIEKYYDIEIIEDFEHAIELIAIKRNLLKKGAQPDIERTSKMIIHDWQKGKIR